MTISSPAPTSQPPRRELITTEDFKRWVNGLGPERQAKVRAAVARVQAGGPTLGRPRVDSIHGTRLRKLKEVRVDRGTRLLFAFDSGQNLVMLVGGDKAGKWNRWYPKKILRAEGLDLDHERRIGKEPRCPSRRAAASRSPQVGR